MDKTNLRNLPFPASFRSIAPHEAEATALYIFQHSMIPGLLQTEAYARAILETHPMAGMLGGLLNSAISGATTRDDAIRPGLAFPQIKPTGYAPPG